MIDNDSMLANLEKHPRCLVRFFRYKYRSLANLSMTESCYGVNEYLPESIKGK